MTIFHAQLAVSLDMRIARADGSVDWLEAFRRANSASTSSWPESTRS